MEPIFSPILALTLNFDVVSVVALVAGILILIRPALLSYIVAIYLIIVGVLGIIGPI